MQYSIVAGTHYLCKKSNMQTDIFSPEAMLTFKQIQDAANSSATKNVQLNGTTKIIPYPFPSPTDWRDCMIYFLITDRFNNPSSEPKSTFKVPAIEWDQKFDFRQGGTFKGVQQQLEYIASLGAGAIWISPVLKNSKPDHFAYNYHGYSTQDFMTVDERFGSDGTSETAEKELIELVEEAHARGLYVILDIVINHATEAFDYEIDGGVKNIFSNEAIMNGPFGSEPPIEWLNGFGFPRSDWRNTLPSPDTLSPDDAIWPKDLQRADFFRRRGNKISDAPGPGGFATGDFGTMRQMVVEYEANSSDQKALRDKYGINPVLSILIRTYQYLVAKLDIDGFRIDTVKYVAPGKVENFGNAIREFALSIGKKNFFMFGEIYDDEKTIAKFVGRHSTDTDSFGIDAALDFPLFFALPGVAKGNIGVEAISGIFKDRKSQEKGLLSTHAEAGRYFVTFLDNHDQNERFNHPRTPEEQVLLGLTTQFCLQGIPCIYYGTEQGLNGTKDTDGNPVLDSNESVREAIWGRKPIAFDGENIFYKQIQALTKLRFTEPALRYGRLYFRQVSGNGRDFGDSTGKGGILAFSRILNNREVLIAANTNPTNPFKGFILLDLDLNRALKKMKVAFSNKVTPGEGTVTIIDQANFFESDKLVSTGTAAGLFVELAPMEIQVLVPEN
ncbi:MAG: alpha-amylase family glycosyl hydrolase [Ferruginibacter sp.]